MSVEGRPQTEPQYVVVEVPEGEYSELLAFLQEPDTLCVSWTPDEGPDFGVVLVCEEYLSWEEKCGVGLPDPSPFNAQGVEDLLDQAWLVYQTHPRVRPFPSSTSTKV